MQLRSVRPAAEPPRWTPPTGPGAGPVRVGGVDFGAGGFVVIAGPCAVESFEQLEGAAAAVARHGAHLLRGGVYKPRTSPHAFQGLGPTGAALLADAGRRHRLPVVAEVTDASQLPLLAGCVDLLQVGARNMQNFELLKALGRLGRPVLLKRGFCATLDEWLLAAEYVTAGGDAQVVLCERGIRTFGHETRFTLDLGAVAWLKARSPLPVVVDPSHATGQRALVEPLALAAAAAGADGLMVEVHPDPERARCDGPQALTPADFARLMARLAPVLAATGRALQARPAWQEVASP